MENKETNKEEFKDLKERMAKENIERQKTPFVRKFEVISYDKEESDRIINWAKKNEYCYARVKHDRDTKPDGTLKKTHYHTIVSMPDGRYMYDLASTLNIDLNRMEKPKTKKGQWENMLAYLGHDTPGAIAAGKPHYEPDEIEYNVEPYADFLARYKAKGNEIAAKKNKNVEVENTIQRIISGEITEFNQTEKIDPMLWVKNERLIKNAFKFYREKMLANPNRNMTVYYFHGTTGTGKTTMATEFAKMKGMSYFVTGASNDPLEMYRGQDVVIFDEFKDSTMTAQDFLKLIEPHTNSAAKSRFSNVIMYAKILIFTSNIKPDDLYNKGKTDTRSREAIFRKTKQFWEFTKEEITIKEWTGQGINTRTIKTIQNPTPYVIKKREAEEKEKPIDLMEALIDFNEKIKNEYENTEEYKQKKAAYEAAIKAQEEREKQFQKEADKAGISLEEWYEAMLPA